ISTQYHMLKVHGNARASVAPHFVEVLHISGGCLSKVTKERREFRRTASQTRFLVPFCRTQKGTRLPGRDPASELKK
ncbi:MAG: hypothetical protein KBT18_06080, partial [Comamonas sp.]|nr:hypothetical protein [Candidatus Comamonas equi]